MFLPLAGTRVLGPALGGGCRALSGTSVASPLVAGAAALLISALGDERRGLATPAALRQAKCPPPHATNPPSPTPLTCNLHATPLTCNCQIIAGGARRLRGTSAFEQGHGALNLSASLRAVDAHRPHVSALPEAIDLGSCTGDGDGDGGDGGGGGGGDGGAGGGRGYLWPLCDQPLFSGAAPLVINVTILNGIGRAALVDSATGTPTTTGAAQQRPIAVTLAPSATLWPWGGALGVAVAPTDAAAGYVGIVEGSVDLVISAVDASGDRTGMPAKLAIPLAVRITPPPPRRRRLLWDTWHSLRYPPAYLPRDDLGEFSPKSADGADALDARGDHPHTNYLRAWSALRDAGVPRSRRDPYSPECSLACSLA